MNDSTPPTLKEQLNIDKEFQELIPSLSSEERELLEASIKSEGCRDAIVVWKNHNTIIDGHNRYSICTASNLPFKTVEREFDSREDVTVWIIRNQFGRRNLTPFVRSELALKLKSAIATKAKANQATSTGGFTPQLKQNFAKAEAVNTNAEIAKAADVSREQIRKVEVVTTKAPEQVKEAARRGDISTHQAYELTRTLQTASEPVRQQVIEIAEKGDMPSVQQVKTMIKQEKRQEKVETLQEQAWLTKTFNVIYADPPWRYEHVKTENRAIENHYPTMTLDDICALPIKDITADDAILFLWATSPKLAEAMRVISSWGFVYRTCAIWDKEKIGMGYYFRQQHELLLVASKGALPVPEPSDRVSSVVRSERGRHSEKPELFYEIIEAMYPTYPKVELFSRNIREGWSGWGNEYASAA